METPLSVILASNLARRFGRHEALVSASLCVECGGIHALIGPNGAGKSTLLRCVLGLTAYDSGYLDVMGVRDGCRDVAVRRQVRGTLDAPSVTSHLSALAQVTALAHLLALPPRSASEALEFVGLDPATPQRAGHFSSGMKQKLGLACAFLGRPRTVLLDEPLSTLDPDSVASLRDVMTDYTRDGNHTIVMSSHHLDELARLASAVTVLKHGRTVFEGTIRELRSQAAARWRVRGHPVDHVRQSLALWGPVERDGAFYIANPGLSCHAIEEHLRTCGVLYGEVDDARSLEDGYLSV